MKENKREATGSSGKQREATGSNGRVHWGKSAGSCVPETNSQGARRGPLSEKLLGEKVKVPPNPKMKLPLPKISHP